MKELEFTPGETDIDYRTDYESSWRARYHEYLRSPEWRAIRGRVMRRAGFICEACLNAGATQVHHETYKRGRYTPAWDLRAVCDDCHSTLTAIDAGEVRAWGWEAR